jgi:hypothetical protein
MDTVGLDAQMISKYGWHQESKEMQPEQSRLDQKNSIAAGLNSPAHL